MKESFLRYLEIKALQCRNLSSIGDPFIYRSGLLVQFLFLFIPLFVIFRLSSSISFSERYPRDVYKADTNFNIEVLRAFLWTHSRHWYKSKIYLYGEHLFTKNYKISYKPVNKRNSDENRKHVGKWSIY